MEILINKFIEVIPDHLEEGVLYISMERRVAIHLCICGCKNEVVTPFSPTDWELRYYGNSVSLSPSIGNWGFPCQSHYWIVKNKIRWSGKWNRNQIEAGKNLDRQRKKYFFENPVKTRTPEESLVKKKKK